jgi:hypothetical protein
VGRVLIIFEGEMLIWQAGKKPRNNELSPHSWVKRVKHTKVDYSPL